MKKALFLCDYNGCPYHGGEDCDKYAAAALAPDFETDFCGDWAALRLHDLQKYDLVVDYISCTRKPLYNDGFIGALTAYAALGGRVLGIHSALIVPPESAPELLHLFGARFLGHPARTELVYTAAQGEEQHPIAAGLAPFTLFEEPYGFEVDLFTNSRVIIEFTYEGERRPAVWEHKFGEGRVVYMQPGHDPAVFAEQAFADLLLRCARELFR